MSKHFADRLIETITQVGNPCEIGLDPVIEYMPRDFLAEFGITTDSIITNDEAENIIYNFNIKVIDAISDIIGIVKPQSAYYEKYGYQGIRALENTISYAREKGLLIILDAKRGDIGSTSGAYADAYLEQNRPTSVDCMTLNPYLGEDSISPFIDKCSLHNTGVFICVMTSNLGANTFQKIKIKDKFLYEKVAEMVKFWADQNIGKSGYSNIGAVVGATFPDEASLLREKIPNSFFLVPGFGVQKGSLEGIRNSFNSDGLGCIVNNARAVLYPDKFGENKPSKNPIRDAAIGFITDIKSCLGN